MKTLKADLAAANKRLEQQTTAMELAIYDLVARPESVIWIEAGKPGSETWISWGLVRITSAAGGYVIRREGKHVRPIVQFDRAVSEAEQARTHRILSVDPAIRQQTENERKVYTQAIETRRKAIQLEEQKRIESMTDLAINPTGKTP